MDDRQRFTLSSLLLVIGGLLSLGWVVTSMLGLFGAETGGALRVVGALGPLGIVLVILGGVLCGWNLPDLRRRARGE